jgi:O-antigen/teichoic acid export membrane protein
MKSLLLAIDYLKSLRLQKLPNFLFRSFETQTFLANIFILFFQFLTSVLLARWLGPKGRGELAAALLWPTVLIYVGSLGLIDSVAYHSARSVHIRTPIYSTAVALAFLQGLLLIPIASLMLPILLSSQDANVIVASRLCLLIIPISLTAQYGYSVLQGHMVLAGYNLLRNLRPIGYLIGAVLLHTFDQLSILNIVILQIILNLLVLVGTLVLLRRRRIPLGRRFSRGTAKMLLLYGLKIHVGRMSGVMNERLDQLLLAAFLPPLQLGLYVTAVSTTVFFMPLAQAISTVLIPRVAQTTENVRQISQIETSFQSFWLISLILIPFAAIALPFAIPIVFGAGYDGAIFPAELLLIASLFSSARVVLTSGAMAMGNAWLGSLAELISLLVTAITLAALLPLFGIVGASLATLLAYVTSLSVIVYGLQTQHSIRWSSLFKVNWTIIYSRMGKLQSFMNPSRSRPE